MPASAKTEMTIRIDTAQRDALDALAARDGRDRSQVVSQAVEAWLELQAAQEAHIRQGLAQADAGNFAEAGEVQAVLDRWRRASG
ncbi:CopG family ribbon-helix-helix protein [Roseomonas sp. F4]